VTSDLAGLKSSIVELRGARHRHLVAESGPEAARMLMAAAGAGAGPGAELVPKHIEVSATVDGRFVAGPTAGGAA
jgi:hypothetical protein